VAERWQVRIWEKEKKRQGFELLPSNLVHFKQMQTKPKLTRSLENSFSHFVLVHTKHTKTYLNDPMHVNSLPLCVCNRRDFIHITTSRYLWISAFIFTRLDRALFISWTTMEYRERQLFKINWEDGSLYSHPRIVLPESICIFPLVSFLNAPNLWVETLLLAFPLTQFLL